MKNSARQVFEVGNDADTTVKGHVTQHVVRLLPGGGRCGGRARVNFNRPRWAGAGQREKPVRPLALQRPQDYGISAGLGLFDNLFANRFIGGFAAVSPSVSLPVSPSVSRAAPKAAAALMTGTRKPRQ